MIANIKRYAMRRINLNPMAQETAVEWLEEQLNKWSDGRFYLPPHLFEKAKEMEKEQIIAAFDVAYQDEDRIGREYYEETYKKQ